MATWGIGWNGDALLPFVDILLPLEDGLLLITIACYHLQIEEGAVAPGRHLSDLGLVDLPRHKDHPQ
jgi:hypothetical protein